MKIRKLVKQFFRVRKKHPRTAAPAEEKQKTNPDVSLTRPFTITSVEDFWGYRDR